MNTISRNNILEMDFGIPDDLCEQTVFISDEVFEPSYTDNDELRTVPGYCDNGTRDTKSDSATNTSMFSLSKRQQKALKCPMREDEILLPCAYCSRIISYENYEKHLAVHTSEHAAILNKNRDCSKDGSDQTEVICVEGCETIVCRVCKESIPASIFKHHLVEHTNTQPVLPIETVMIKEEMMWNDSETIETTDGGHDMDPTEEECEMELLAKAPSVMVRCTKCRQLVPKKEMSRHRVVCGIAKEKTKSKQAKKRRNTTPGGEKKTDEITEPCTICHRVVSANNMEKHRRTHLVEKPSVAVPSSKKSTCHDPKAKLFVCFHCDQGFARYSDLREHQTRQEDEKRFLCTICYRGFYQCYHLKTHHVAHHKNLKFSVKEVARKNSAVSTNETSVPEMAASSALHMKRILSDKFSSCPYCKLVFGCFKELSEHMQTHKKETSVTCALCQKCVSMENVVHKWKAVFMCSSCSSTLLPMDSSLIDATLVESERK